MKELDNLFNDIKLQLNIEKSNYKKLKYVNIRLKLVKLLFYH